MTPRYINSIASSVFLDGGFLAKPRLRMFPSSFLFGYQKTSDTSLKSPIRLPRLLIRRIKERTHEGHDRYWKIPEVV